jgi:type I restriction enzyme S subunit
MGSEWRWRTLGELTDNFDSIRVPVKELDRRPGPYPYYGASGVVDHVDRYLFDGEYLLIAEDGENLRTRTTPVAFLAGGRFWVNNHSHVVRGNSEADTRFLMYALAAADIGGYLSGSAMPKLTQASLNRIPLFVPQLAEQRRIADILSALDDKIELNRRMSQTLESMARALFKSWFVDFDPVRAKAEGRSPSVPSQFADLFPKTLEDSERGEVPSGWRQGRLGDVLVQRVERCIASADTASRPYVPIECISPRSLSLIDARPGEEAQSSLTKFHAGDLLFGAMRPYFHKVCIAPFDGTTRTTAFVLRPRRDGDFAFSTLWLHSPDTIDYATQHSTGSTIPYAVWSGSLEHMPGLLPPPEVRDAFDTVARPLLGRLQEPYFQNETLTAARDALLPTLLCGDIGVGAIQ